MTIALRRRLLAEFLGTALLVTVVVGSGIMATRCRPTTSACSCWRTRTATAFGLGGADPDLRPGLRRPLQPGRVRSRTGGSAAATGTGLTGRELGGYVAAQVAGAIGGAILANLMFDLPAGRRGPPTTAPPGTCWLGEVVATAGLILLIFALARVRPRPASRRPRSAPTSAPRTGSPRSTSFANPAVTIGRAFTDTFAGIAPASVPGFVIAQLVGAARRRRLCARCCTPTPAKSPTRSSCSARRIPDRPDRAPRTVKEHDRCLTSPASCSSACTTPAAPRWPPAGCATSPATRVEVRSAGSAPADQINPAAVAGHGRGRHRHHRQTPSSSTDDTAEASDVIITMGCGDACPVFPGKRYEDWKLDDPAGQGVDAVRPIRDEIRTRVETAPHRAAPHRLTRHRRRPPTPPSAGGCTLSRSPSCSGGAASHVSGVVIRTSRATSCCHPATAPALPSASTGR